MKRPVAAALLLAFYRWNFAGSEGRPLKGEHTVSITGIIESLKDSEYRLR